MQFVALLISAVLAIPHQEYGQGWAQGSNGQWVQVGNQRQQMPNQQWQQNDARHENEQDRDINELQWDQQNLENRVTRTERFL